MHLLESNISKKYDNILSRSCQAAVLQWLQKVGLIKITWFGQAGLLLDAGKIKKTVLSNNGAKVLLKINSGFRSRKCFPNLVCKKRIFDNII